MKRSVVEETDRLQAREVTYTGGGRSGRPRGPDDQGRIKLTGEPGPGFRWDDPREPNDDEIELLASVADGALRRVAALRGEPANSREAALTEENKKLREALAAVNELVRAQNRP